MDERLNSPEGRDVSSVIHGLTDLRLHRQRGPLLIEEGDGVFVRDREGNEYLEGMAGLWCTSLGYGEQRLIDAATTQMSRLPYSHLTDHKGHMAVVELAEKLLEISPVPMSRVWFSNSGSEGNDSAIRLVWYYWDAIGQPERRKIIAHDRAYHGNTIATASLSGTTYSQAGFNLPLPGFLKVTCPDYYREGREGETEEAFSQRLADELEQLINEEGPETIAGFFTEPVIAAGGVVVPPLSYFARIQKILDRYEIILVADEVVTAFGRTGKMFGSETMALRPDMIVCAKALSGAYFPISALLINDRIYQAMLTQAERRGVFGLSLTYSGHPVGAAVAREAIRIYEERNIPAHVRSMEAKFLGGLKDLGSHPIVGNVRGIGLLAGVELVADKDRGTRYDPGLTVGLRCARKAEANGLLIRAIGDIIAFCPPLIISEGEIVELTNRFAAALDETAAELQVS
jgi:4-aminobutyrate--pyruvate transaminase